MCDANDFPIGVALGKMHDKVFNIIYYDSKTLIKAQINYTTTKNEILVVVITFDNFKS